MITAEVVLAFELLIEHGKDPFAKLIHYFVYLLLRRPVAYRRKLLGTEHFAGTLSHRSHSLLERLEKRSQLNVVTLHVHAIFVSLLLISVADVHHLDKSLTVNGLPAVLQNRNVSRWMCSLELRRLIITI